jgi:hypothetical protein
MALFRIALILLACAAAAGQYFQERYRLSVIQKLSGPAALAYYEARRRNTHRTMTILAVVSGVLGLAALVDLLLHGR